MKKILTLIATSCIFLMAYTPVYAGLFSQDANGNDISKENFMISVSEFFPSLNKNTKIAESSGEGINNITSLINSFIPLITIFMAAGATLMVIWGGYQMIFGGANPAQTESGKGIIKDAMIGLLIGLLGYVIVFWLGGGKKSLINIDQGATGLPGENANNIISVFRSVIGRLQDVSAIIAVIGICLVGIMYIMSHGDEEKTTAAKKYMVAILIGTLLAFAAWGMMSLINIIPNSFNLSGS